jgi:predicted nucleic-acid-binding protein
VIGIDTNVLVRYLTDDEPEMAGRAERFLEQECAPDRPGFINLVVLCEVVWVLKAHYRLAREQIAAAIDALLRAPQVAVERGDLVERALMDYRRGKVGFADVLIGLINQRSGCEATATFDREAAALDSFRLL